MSKKVLMTRKCSFEDLLREDGFFLYTAKGVSMMPLLKEQRDIIEVRAVQEPLKKYDVVLYKRKGTANIFVLHRLIDIRPDGKYIFAGDNNAFKEYNVTDEDILGVMTRFIRNGKSIYVTNPLYKLYCVVWVGLYPLRVLFIKCKNRVHHALF